MECIQDILHALYPVRVWLTVTSPLWILLLAWAYKHTTTTHF
jgi:hypothetical protein